jgi:hypothetical protein
MAGKRDSGEDILREIQRSGGQGNSGKAQQQIAEALAALDAEQQQIKEETKKQKQSILTKKDVKDIFEDLYKKEEDKRDKKLKSTLKQAFKEMYDSEEKKRQATSPKSATESQTDQNANQDYKRDVNEMRYGLGSVGSTARENNALLREQINLQTRSISLLNDISQTLKGMGGLGGGINIPGLPGGSKKPSATKATPPAGGGRGKAALGVLGVAAAGAGALYAGNKLLGDEDEEESSTPSSRVYGSVEYAEGGSTATPTAGSTPPPAPPASSSASDPDKNKTAAVLEAEKKGDKKKNNLSITANKMSFKADKLTFSVDSLTIDAKSVKKSQISSLQQKNVSSSARSSSSQPPGAAPAGTPGATSSTQSSNATTTGASAATGGTGSSSSMGGAGGAAPRAAGSSENAKKAIDFFKQRGWSAEQAAAIVGNLQAESGRDLNPGAVGDGGKAMGIAQWHPDRRKNFEKFFGKPFSESNFEEQLAFVDWELHNTEKRAGNALREAKSGAEAASIVDSLYERSSGIHRQQRISNTSALLEGRTEAPGAKPSGGAGGATAVAKPEAAGARSSGGMKDVLSEAGEIIGQVPDAGESKLEKRKSWWESTFGQSDEEKKAILAKTQEIEKNGPAMTAMGDIGAPGGANAEAKADVVPLPVPRPKNLDKPATKTIEVNDPNWDRHAVSRKMFEEATARENRGENSQSIYWAAEAQRKKELAASPPKIKKTIAAPVEKAPAGIPGAIQATGYGEGDPLAQVSAVREDPEVLSESGLKEDSAQREVAGMQVAGHLGLNKNKMAAEHEAERLRRQGVATARMEDADNAGMYSQDTRLQQAQIEKTATADNLVASGMTPAQTGRAATGRNMAGAIGGGPEASREKQQAQDADYNNMEIDDKAGDKPSASLSSGDGWLTKFFPYLYGSGDKPSMRVGAD